MKKSEHFFALLVLLCIGATNLFGQNSNKAFKHRGESSQSIEIDSTFSATTELRRFTKPLTSGKQKLQRNMPLLTIFKQLKHNDFSNLISFLDKNYTNFGKEIIL